MIINNISVLGVFPPFWSDQGPHFILPHFQGMMKSLGVDVQIIDLNIESAITLKEGWKSMSENFGNIWNNPQKVEDFIEKSGIADRLVKAITVQQPSWVLFLSVNIASYQVARFLIRDVRSRFSKSNVRIAIGGPLCVGLKDSVNLFPEADFVWSGTLESAIPLLMGQNIQMKTQDFSNHIFFPDFTGIDITKYSKPQRLPYILNYGCRFNCRFCHEGAQYSKEIKRSIFGLSNHLKSILTTFPTVECVVFCDSSLNSDHGYFLDLLDELDGKNILWGCYLAPTHYINQAICKRMISAGCIGVNMGVESGSSAVRKLMRKPTNLDVVESCIRELHTAGIFVHINFMVGYPGETEFYFNETLTFASKIAEYVSSVTVNITGIFAGTPLFADAQKLGIHLNGDIQNEFLFNQWALVDGSNTESIRIERSLRLESHLASFGLINSRSPNAVDPGIRALEYLKGKKTGV